MWPAKKAITDARYRESRPVRTVSFPGTLVYYVLYGGYLALLLLLGRKLSSQRREQVIQRLGWTDLYSYLTWIILHLGLPTTATVVVESRLLGVTWRIEPGISKLLSRLQGNIFVDVGSYHGHYSILLRKRFSAIAAIEPVPANMAVLRRSLAYRRVPNVRTLKVAVGTKEAVGRLRLMPQLSESRVDPQSGSGKDSVTVRIVTLDETLDEHDMVDLVKVDVEGAEFAVLKGASNSFGKVKSWLVELHDPRRSEELEYLLLTKHYRTKWVDKGHLLAWRAGTVLG